MGSTILASAAQPGGLANYSFFIMLALMFGVFYFLIIRPQKKRAQQHQEMINSLQKGEKVITSSGMIGTIYAIHDEQNKVVLKVADEVKVEFVKSSIASKVQS